MVHDGCDSDGDDCVERTTDDLRRLTCNFHNKNGGDAEAEVSKATAESMANVIFVIMLILITAAIIFCPHFCAIHAYSPKWKKLLRRECVGISASPTCNANDGLSPVTSE